MSSMRPLLAALAALVACAWSGSAQPVGWELWQRLPLVVDVGALSDGRLLAMAGGRLYEVSRADGTYMPFAGGPDGFAAGNPDAESYFVVAQPLTVEAAGCSFNADDLFVLDLTTPPGLARIDSTGRSSRFATLGGVTMLSGIAIDTNGRFDHRLLVTGSHDNLTTVFAVDCLGSATVLTDRAPTVEGGLAVAPPGFGEFGGDLIAPDELSGQVWAIAPDGTVRLVAVPNLPVGGDTGVESNGFVPPGFLAVGGTAYLADRGTPNNPFPGNDSILRLSSAAIASAGVREGDLLISIEGGGTTVAIHCDVTCSVTPVALGTPGGHIEGKIALLLDQPVVP
jgi:hypothetical protein